MLLARRGFGLLLPLRLSATAARMRSFKAASSTLSPSWMSMARLAFPSRPELNRPEGSFNAAPLGNVILTMFLHVSPVQTMPPWDQMGVPIHFHSSRISGSCGPQKLHSTVSRPHVTLLGVNIDKRLSMIRLQSRAHERLLPCPTGGSDNDGQWGLGSGLRGWACVVEPQAAEVGGPYRAASEERL